MIHVYNFDLEAMDNSDWWVRMNPDAYLFSYDGEFEWEWYTISVNGKNYRFCMGDKSGKPDKNYFVEEFFFKKDTKPTNTVGHAVCPACGNRLDWEQEDGICRCETCYSDIEKITNVESGFDGDLIGNYQVRLIKKKQPHKLDPSKIKYIDYIERTDEV